MFPHRYLIFQQQLGIIALGLMLWVIVGAVVFRYGDPREDDLLFLMRVPFHLLMWINSAIPFIFFIITYAMVIR